MFVNLRRRFRHNKIVSTFVERTYALVSREDLQAAPPLMKTLTRAIGLAVSEQTGSIVFTAHKVFPKYETLWTVSENRIVLLAQFLSWVHAMGAFDDLSAYTQSEDAVAFFRDQLMITAGELFGLSSEGEAFCRRFGNLINNDDAQTAAVTSKTINGSLMRKEGIYGASLMIVSNEILKTNISLYDDPDAIKLCMMHGLIYSHARSFVIESLRSEMNKSR